MFVYPCVRIRPEFLDKAPRGATGAASLSGWINKELFSKWFDHFISWSQPKHRPQPTSGADYGWALQPHKESRYDSKGKGQQRYPDITAITQYAQALAIRHSPFQKHEQLLKPTMIRKCKLGYGVILEE